MKDVAECMGFGLVGLHLKGTLRGELFIISNNWLTLGGAIFLGSARPQMLNHQNTENKRHG